MKENNSKKIISAVAIILVCFVVIYFLLKTKNKEIESTDTDTENIVDSIEEGSKKDETVKQNDTTSAKNELEVTYLQDEVDVFFQQAIDKERKGDFTGAKLSLDQAFKLAPKNPFANAAYANLYFKTKDYSNALIWISKALVLDSKNIDFWYQKIDIVKSQSNNTASQTEQVYVDALKATNNNVNIVTAYASWLGGIGRREDSIKQWERSIELYPTNKAIYQGEIDRLKELIK